MKVWGINTVPRNARTEASLARLTATSAFVFRPSPIPSRLRPAPLSVKTLVQNHARVAAQLIMNPAGQVRVLAGRRVVTGRVKLYRQKENAVDIVVVLVLVMMKIIVRMLME